jgi:hypothetical protein
MTGDATRPPSTFVRGNGRLDQLLSDPWLAADVAEAHVAAEEIDRVYAMNLAMIRKAAQMTQSEVAKKLGGRSDSRVPPRKPRGHAPVHVVRIPHRHQRLLTGRVARSRIGRRALVRRISTSGKQAKSGHPYAESGPSAGFEGSPMPGRPPWVGGDI